MKSIGQPSTPAAWRLQDAKAQFSALVDSAMRGVPQHVTRSGKRAVVVLSELDFETLQRSAASRLTAPSDFLEHLLAMPKVGVKGLPDDQRLNVQPRDVDFS